ALHQVRHGALGRGLVQARAGRYPRGNAGRAVVGAEELLLWNDVGDRGQVMSEATPYAEESPDEIQAESWTVKNIVDLDWALSRIWDLEREQEENLLLETEAITRLKLRTQPPNEPLS